MNLLALIVLHPAVVHFPIALLTVCVALTVLHLRRPDPFVERAAYGALVLGWWGTFAAILTGTLELALNWPLPANVVGWLNLHAALGLLLLALFGQALLRRRRDPAILDGPGRAAYLRLLLVGFVALLVDGVVGGHLVYGLHFGIR